MIEKITLSNGVRIVLDRIDHVRSVAFGIWVGNGSRFEPEQLCGVSHFIEHMLFKGTEKRTAQHIAIAFDALGGQVNAFTTKECTCYYMKVLDSRFQQGVSILTDMFLHSKFDPRDIELERGVVLEEIDMYEDTPEDVATEKLFEGCFSGSALGRPILGTEETLNSMDTNTLKDYMEECYRPQDTVIAISGSFSQEDLDYVCEMFSAMKGEGRNAMTPACYHPCLLTRPKDIEQNHVALGFPGIAMGAEEKYSMQILNGILGGGMSSRLFQRVREENGLCYSIYSYCSAHRDTGLFSIYTALSQPMEDKAVAMILREIARFKEEGPTRDELSRCREQMKTNLLMGLESTNARMNLVGKSELFYDRFIPIEETLQCYDQVSRESVMAVAEKVLDFDQIALCAVGETADPSHYAELLRS